jgi:hypothetical protein
MQIFIKFVLDEKQCSQYSQPFRFPLNSSKTMIVDVEPENTLAEVKDFIQLQSGLLPIEQNLWFGHNLAYCEEKSLKELNIKKESTLLLTHSGKYPPTLSSPSMLVAKGVLEKRSVGFIKQLLDQKGDPNSRYMTSQYPKSYLQETALHYAAWCRDEREGVQIMSLLLERKANIHALADPYGTPLHFATHYSRDQENIQFLLKNGANPWIGFRGTRSIDNIKNTSLTSLLKNVEGTCSICLEPHSLSTTQAILPCQHFFHMTCITKVQLTSSLCPLCRREINKDTIVIG